MTSSARSHVALLALVILFIGPFLVRDDQLRVSFLRGMMFPNAPATTTDPSYELYHRRTEAKHNYRRPVMHTYFSSLPADQNNMSASMSINVHDSMIQVWEEAWRDAGWHTRILTIEDAKTHPEFNFFESYIQNFTTNDYNKACYYRWLAMAAAGGGWMSDYDTMPLHSFTDDGFDLPMKGALVVYEGPHVPSLLSGSASEWLRMTKRLVEFAANHKNENGWTVSDMISLSELIKKHRNIYVYQKDVAGSNAIRINTTWTPEACKDAVPRRMRAAHFSHEFIEIFWIKNHPNYTLDDRPMIEKVWLNSWLEHCGRQTWQATTSISI